LSTFIHAGIVIGPDGIAAAEVEPAGAAAGVAADSAGAAAAVVSAVLFALFPPPHAPSATAIPIDAAYRIFM